MMSLVRLGVFLSCMVMISSCASYDAQRNVADSVSSGQKNGRIIRLGRVHDGGHLVETTLINFRDRIYRLESVRPDSDGNTTKQHFLRFVDVETGERYKPFGLSYSLADAIVENDRIYVVATHFISNRSTFGNYITLFSSDDLVHWDDKIVFQTDDVPGETIFNVSIARDDKRWIMVYETNDNRYPAFTMKFAESHDLKMFRKINVPFFRTDQYTGSPYLIYCKGYFYFIHLSQKSPAWSFETHIARSSDLQAWEYGNRPFLIPNKGEKINTSDVTMLEYGGITLINYSFGDQRGDEVLASAIYPGKMQNLLESFFE